MTRRFSTSLLVAILLALPAAATAASSASGSSPAPAPAAFAPFTWWADLVAQVRSAILPAAVTRPDPAPTAARTAGARRGHRLVPACSGGMDPDGHCS